MCATLASSASRRRLATDDSTASVVVSLVLNYGALLLVCVAARLLIPDVLLQADSSKTTGAQPNLAALAASKSGAVR